MPQITVNNHSFYYETQGKGHPLVLICGYTLDIHSWAGVRNQLAERFEIILFDNRGSGKSSGAKHPFTIEDMAKDTWSIIQHLGLKKPHILGTSLGALIAQVIVHQHGSEIGKTVLCSPTLKLLPVSAAALSLPARLRRDGVSTTHIVEAIMPWIFSNTFMGDHKKVSEWVDRLSASAESQSASDQKMQIDALLKFDSTPWFKSLKNPIFALCGEEDILFPPHDFKKLSNVQYKGIPHMGHSLRIESPVTWCEEVLKFLS